jgi:demethylspheroidene O-methyltransferase
MAATPGAAPMGATYFGFYLLAMGSGRARTPDELAAMLQQAGFRAPRLLRTRQPLQVQALIAERA